MFMQNELINKREMQIRIKSGFLYISPNFSTQMNVS